MEAYKIEKLNKQYGDKIIFDDLDLSISYKERIGLVGINGTGKSTLLKVIANIDDDYDAKTSYPNQYQIAYASQKPELDESLTVIDEVLNNETEMTKVISKYENALNQYQQTGESKDLDLMMKYQSDMDRLNAWDYSADVKTILSKLGINDYLKKIATLSGGQKKRVALAKELIRKPDLLLLDEPTNHLDIEGIEWLVNYIKQYPHTIMFVTHDRHFLNQVSTRIVELSNGKLTSYPGNYEAYIEARAEKEEIAAQQHVKKKALYKQELNWMRQGAKARSTKQQARIQRFNTLEEDLSNRKTQGEASLNLAHSRLGKQVFELDDISKSVGDRKLFEHFTTIIQKGDRIGIVGENGAGKTTLLNIISGLDQTFEGNLITGQTVKIAYFKQQDESLTSDKRMIDYLREESEVAKEKDGTVVSVTQLLERFLFPSQTHGTQINKLSGGEQKRLYLLKLLVHEPNVLILDEPTNDLDTETLTILEAYINEFGGTVITVSHDRYFLNKVANKYWYIHDQQIEPMLGTFEDYLEYKRELEKKVTQQHKEVQKTETKPKTSARLSFKEKRELEQLEKNIEYIETRLEEIDQEMVEHATNYEKLNELANEKTSIETQYEEDYMRWSSLSDRL
ncbi:ABC-F family ATP-binding cassette domain-containing protein [Mammaliicoccus sciuri]|uniref:ABC-F family ATP-binding cassette domain-containing protein n=1 Tax=Mammaliicoccus sciuri TaxID=1296 RepID=UPI00046E5987|nr:ABC-F family ATP-binding cassette domain-containing protein [Mammaliicoccus sciuri]MCD8799244.1 ABC-F family ATP-binding cassette domain-containing protein [Mammaliicoccus sciuri]MCJ0967717.1 ABC-F family ATP-binding cassette domain-containing protein [Mammaliicoccus sciuri]MEB5648342.1 ABC-F family ATP-binding cassette domain-containing protein [Mammaliicoccus sciuri]MEB6338893.1 ABC-F family ATP-binding cassette domain-containing protein [Mammaliicoccus sciuri]MEB7463762.1 ABC-F family AT